MEDHILKVYEKLFTRIFELKVITFHYLTGHFQDIPHQTSYVILTADSVAH
jgi:hypothetical protein